MTTDTDQDGTVTTTFPGEREALERALAGARSRIQAERMELHNLMDHPAIHGELRKSAVEGGEDYHTLSEEWHLLHAAIMALNAGRTLVDQAAKTLKGRPA